MSKKSSVQSLMGMAGKFVAKQEGVWDHEQWEKLVGDAEEDGFRMDEEGRRSLGLILEGARHFHAQEAAHKAEKKKEKKDKAEAKKAEKKEAKPKTPKAPRVKAPKVDDDD